MVFRVTQPLARELRWRIVAKADSMTLVVRRCVQCAAGKSYEREQLVAVAGQAGGGLGVLVVVALAPLVEGALGLRPRWPTVDERRHARPRRQHRRPHPAQDLPHRLPRRRHPQGRRPKLAVKPHDAQRIARPERRHAVDRHPREKRPRARAEWQRRFEGTQYPPPAHDAHRAPVIPHRPTSPHRPGLPPGPAESHSSCPGPADRSGPWSRGTGSSPACA